MKYGSRNLRHELKYLISYADYYTLKSTLAAFMEPDENAGEDGGYTIRSLYFDDIYDSSLHDKDSGVSRRRKHRIRIYNYSDSVVKLEMKDKFDAYISKVSAKITARQAARLINGNCDFLIDSASPAARSAYIDFRTHLLRPRVIVDYEREAFVCDEGNVRITFDRDLRAAYGSFDIFDPDLLTAPAMQPGTMVLEVKYDDFLPGAVRRALRRIDRRPLALSKYVMCRQAKEIYYRRDVPYESTYANDPVKLRRHIQD